jgi:hypothetical protein
VLQVVRGNLASSPSTSTTSTAYIDSGLSATITPITSGNKIVIIASLLTRNNVPTGQDGLVYTKLLVGTSAIVEHINQDDNMGKLGDTVNLSKDLVFNNEYTTTSTSALTFKIQLKVGASNTFYYRWGGADIMLMEIAQ